MLHLIPYCVKQGSAVITSLVFSILKGTVQPNKHTLFLLPGTLSSVYTDLLCDSLRFWGLAAIAEPSAVLVSFSQVLVIWLLLVLLYFKSHFSLVFTCDISVSFVHFLFLYLLFILKYCSLSGSRLKQAAKMSDHINEVIFLKRTCKGRFKWFSLH